MRVRRMKEVEAQSLPAQAETENVIKDEENKVINKNAGSE